MKRTNYCIFLSLHLGKRLDVIKISFSQQRHSASLLTLAVIFTIGNSQQLPSPAFGWERVEDWRRGCSCSQEGKADKPAWRGYNQIQTRSSQEHVCTFGIDDGHVAEGVKCLATAPRDRSLPDSFKENATYMKQFSLGISESVSHSYCISCDGKKKNTRTSFWHELFEFCRVFRYHKEQAECIIQLKPTLTLQWSHLKSREDTVLHSVGDPYQNKRFFFFLF